MDESLYRGFDNRARTFFAQLGTDIDVSKPNRAILKKRFVDEVRRVLHPAPRDISGLRQCFNVAYWAYRKVRRRSGEAFVFHPLRSSLLVAWMESLYGVSDIELLYTTLLHDSYEEFGNAWFAQATIRSAVYFGPGTEVATDVHHLSKKEDETSESYFFRLLTCGKWRVLLVKLVDRIDNIWTLDKKDPARSARKIRETEAWFPRIIHETKGLVVAEFESNGRSQNWLELISFVEGYLWYAVGEKKHEFNLI